MNDGIGGHHHATAATIHWLTPPWILAALGKFDLDPCAAPEPRPWATAHEMWSERGLDRPWHGRVWCNPPYGLEAAAWLEKLAAHGNGTALVFARTETAMFFDHVWDKAAALFFIKGRLTFYRKDGILAQGNAGGPSVLIAYGTDDSERLRTSSLQGKYVRLS